MKDIGKPFITPPLLNMINKKDLIEMIPLPWQILLAEELHASYWEKLADFLAHAQEEKRIIYPLQNNWFAALEATSPEKVRVVILGQDPYHGPNQAHGLSFSVPRDVRIPPSLLNIYKEITRDLGYAMPTHGCLWDWAKQGILLLNAVLTVEHGLAGAHRARGWENFTDSLIKRLANKYPYIVFMLWGKDAKQKLSLIRQDQHCLLQSVHPSPLSAHRGFIGNGHFSAANRYLEERGRGKIDWQIK